MKLGMTMLINLLRSDGSITINKKLAKEIGLQETIFYSELLSKYIYFLEKKQLDEEGYFYSTIEDMEESTTLSKYQQSKVIKKLKELNLIDFKIKGVPATRYFKILDSAEYLISILEGKENQQIDNNLKTRSKKTEQEENEENQQIDRNLQTSCKETRQQVVKKLDSKMSKNCTEIILNNNTNIINKEKEEKQEPYQNDEGFKEIIKTFNQNIHPITPIEVQEIIYYLEDLQIDYRVIIEAIRLAVKRNGRNLSYIERLLQDWHSKGLTTLEAVKAHIRDYQDRKNSKKQGGGIVRNGYRDDAKKESGSTFEGYKLPKSKISDELAELEGEELDRWMEENGIF
ncbi:DnaD domain-containing protein [Tepidibacter thalassicus]|uniref:DnaD and phage-associated domain-containing protein n=1 Tax=Tepidibacter thalassicus DSM 15285 TaxID=1123350 RepID=A0A1M5PX25_9FIRM|nr:DnaD domain protein [Tepidibacter thalassicus]SHH06354.1 DnaD and phage-associated domain-containing protein [Tepidibacter thalassicus DSM 15285]